MVETVVMKCGHAAPGTDGAGRTCCCICLDDPRACEVDPNPPDVTGRVAQCSDCKKSAPSSWSLPLFERRDAGPDRFNCGCRGWE